MAVEPSVTRIADLQVFYGLMDRLIETQGGPMSLANVTTSSVSPLGVYFFFEPGEHRSESGDGQRVVRVGTHGLKSGAASTLHGRLRQHRGKGDGGGNHRGSIFRLLTGDALMRCDEAAPCGTWGSSGVAARASNRTLAMKESEGVLERAVSKRLASMQVACLAIGDEPGPDSQRGWIERNAIALLSNSGKPDLDAPSPEWLGHHSSRTRVRSSGLWNQNHVDEAYAPSFLADLERWVADQGRAKG